MHTINDICEEILLVEDNSFNSELPTLRQLRESQGIVDGYQSIVEEIYNVISNTEPMPYDNDISYLIYRLNDYQIQQDCFINSVNIRVLAGKKGRNFHGSYFEGSYDNIDISNDLKLVNARFTIGIKDNDLKSERGKSEFFIKMTHEIHHAFRYYNICIANNASVEHDKLTRSRYGNIIKSLTNRSDDDNVNFLSPNLYMLNKEEIMSEANELYEYIRQHEEINPNNFTKVIDDLPLFWRLSRASRFIKYLDDILFNKKDEEEITSIGNAYSKLMNFNGITSHKAFLKCRYKVLGMEEYIRNVFFRTVNKAFNDFNKEKQMYDFDLKEYFERNNFLMT